MVEHLIPKGSARRMERRLIIITQPRLILSTELLSINFFIA